MQFGPGAFSFTIFIDSLNEDRCKSRSSKIEFVNSYLFMYFPIFITYIKFKNGVGCGENKNSN